MRLGATPILAAASYAIDITPKGSQKHGWRVALLAYDLAATLLPEAADDVFHAALLHQAGAVGVESVYVSNRPAQNNDTHRFDGSAALLRWLPGMGNAANCLLSVHDLSPCLEAPDEVTRERLSICGQILRLAVSVDSVGCFEPSSHVSSCLSRISAYTGSWWSKEVWVALIDWMRGTDHLRSLTDCEMLPNAMQIRLEAIGTPTELDNEAGVERVLHLIAALVDIKDTSTAGHSQRTARYARQLAEQVGLSKAERAQAYRCGLVHDTGRLGLPGFLFNTSKRLNESSLQTVKQHASMTIQIFDCLPDCPEMTELGYIAGHDHERFNGLGYPDGLQGENIPLLSRVLGVADAFDAMTLPRDFRILSPKAAVLRLKQGAGTQFDPELVEAMISAVESGEIEVEVQQAA